MNAPYSYDDRAAREERRRNSEKRRAMRRRKARMRRLRLLCAALVVVLTVTAAFTLIDRRPAEPELPAEQPEQILASAPAPMPQPEPELPPEPVWAITHTADTAHVSDDFPSKYVVLLERESGKVLTARDSKTRINPASMTKILTLLVAAEHVTDEALTHGSFTMTRTVADYCFVNKCSVVGYEVDEVIPLIELFYGCILCSGADSCLGLANTIFGSHEAMVDAMNAKLDELGLSDTTHFTNCVGLYDKDHYSTVEDIAVILNAALENDLCREVLTTKIYESVPTPQHTKGQVLSNLFSRRIENKDTGDVDVLCAKTGYVEESGFCAASYGETSDGTGYICVTAKSTGTNQSIRDHAALYLEYCPDIP